MCGLFGEFGPQTLTDPRAISKISASIFHRGPDAEGRDSGEGWLLGFRRLAILDLSANGNQPMQSEDGRYRLVLNGEIYNYLELREQLQNGGITFHSGTDTEVLLHLLIRFGADALNMLNGMFALAFVDLQARRYLIARDRLGVKPLQLRLGNGTLRFASELGALTLWPGANPDLDQVALAEYLASGYLPDSRSIHQGYTKLPAGSYVTGDIDRPSLEPKAWWSPKMSPQEDGWSTEAEAAEDLEALLRNAVALRMRSDVPVALLLSGGIDSGLVGSYMAEVGPAPLALVAGFDQKAYDETAYAQQTAARVGMELRMIPLDAGNLAEVDSVAAAYDEPFGDPSALPMLHICKAAREHATVLLTGDGGDEAFAGYRRYIEVDRYRKFLAIPDALRRLTWAIGRNLVRPDQARKLAKMTLPGTLPAAVFDGLGLGKDPAVDTLLAKSLRPCPAVTDSIRMIWNQSEGQDLLSRQRLLDYAHYLPGDVLAKVDRASMAHSTEARSPFLDYRVVEFAARLPKRMLIKDGRGKQILRHLADRRLPAQVAAGSKAGFSVPLGDWIRNPKGAALVRERLTDAERNPHRIWSERGVDALLNAHIAGKRDYGEYFWRLLVLESWLRQRAGRPAA